MQAMLQAAPALKSCSPRVDSTVRIIHGNRRRWSCAWADARWASWPARPFVTS